MAKDKGSPGAGYYFREKKTGNYCWRLSIGPRDDAQKIVVKRKTSAARKIAVQAKIAELEAKGFLQPASTDVTVEEKLNLWLETEIKPPLRARNTYRSYKQTCRDYIIPPIGKEKLSKLTSAHLQKVIHYVRNTLKKSPRTAELAAVTLCVAVGKRIAAILKDEVTIPAGSPPRDRVLELEEIVEVLTECERQEELKTRPGEWRFAYRDRYLIPLLLNMGTRINEALGTQIIRFDRKEETLFVCKQLERWKDEDTGKPMWDLVEPKGKKVRLLPLNPAAVELITRQLALVAEDKERAGTGYDDNGLLFPTESGAPHRDRNVRRTMDRVIETVNANRKARGEPPMEHTTLHDLRRSYLTHLADVEERMQYVAALAGHSNPATTHKYYVRARELGKRTAALKINFGKPVGTTVDTNPPKSEGEAGSELTG